MKPQSVEAHRVFWIVLPPFVIGNVTQRLQRIVAVERKTAFDESSRSEQGLAGAEIGTLQNGAHDAFSRDWILSHILPVARQHAAEIFRPGAIYRAVDDNMVDLPGAQFLGHRRQTEACV